MRRDCTRVSLIEDRRNEHGRQRRNRHTPYVHTYVRASCSPSHPRSLIPYSSPARCSPSYPFDADHPAPPFPAYARARGNGKWGLVISLTFEHSSSSWSRPQRNPSLSLLASLTLFLILLHPRLLPLTPPSFSYTKASIYPVLRVSLRVVSSFYTVRPLWMNLMDDSWYETVTNGRRTVGFRLFVFFLLSNLPPSFSLSVFLHLILSRVCAFWH